MFIVLQQVVKGYNKHKQHLSIISINNICPIELTPLQTTQVLINKVSI